MLPTGDLAVPGGGIEARMAQVLLEQPQAITGVIPLHRVHSKGITQTVWTHVAESASLGIDQLGQACPLSTVPHHLPCPVAVDPEDERSFLPPDWPPAAYVLLEHAKGFVICREGTESPLFLLLGQGIANLSATARAEGVT